MTTITIPRKFNGPPGNGNGGYSAGLLAAYLDGPHTIRINAPIPLETPLALGRENGITTLHDGETLIMTARPEETSIAPRPAPSFEAAKEASERPRAFGAGEQSVCFVCGRNREPGEGLRIFCGQLDGKDTAATVWTPHETFADEDGLVRPEILWSALDCPGGFSLPDVDRALLGEMNANILERPPVGEPLIIASWRTGGKGRKHVAGTALYCPDGTCLAHADTVWFEVSTERFEANA
ncbi:MAG: hypothetical protein RIB03_05090 [Henriciella sp.]|uniref:hypothetical protein n=1 Tax=Henriciella sp. TaxID=1968823 RepID=UPI0032ECF558